MVERQTLPQQERVEQLRHLTKTDPDPTVRRRALVVAGRKGCPGDQRSRGKEAASSWPRTRRRRAQKRETPCYPSWEIRSSTSSETLR